MTTAISAAVPALSSAGTALSPHTSPSAQIAQIDHLSWSAIETYSTCPRKYFYRYIAQAKPEFTPAALLFGGAFHTAIEGIQEARIQGQPIPSVEELLQRFDRHWKDDLKVGAEIRYALNDDASTQRDLATRMLAAFREYVVLNFLHPDSQIIGIEHSHRFRLLAYVPPMEMRLDLLELTGCDLVVSDVKTSKSRWNDAKAQEHLLQLVLYAAGLIPLLHQVGAKRIVPRFLVVTKAKKPVVQVLEPQARQQDVERLKRLVSDTWLAIRKEVFIPRTGWHCSQCPFRQRCFSQ